MLLIIKLLIGVAAVTLSAPLNAQSCRPTALLTGYWPPSNEMLRSWHESADWQGANWRNHGYNVYAHFPEFPPDGDPTNDQIGDPGSVGIGELSVDYQITSRDFWSLVEKYHPEVLITTSRGGDIDWELEGIEGGHGKHGQPNPAKDWIRDRNGKFELPEKGSINERSWKAISTYRLGASLKTTLPINLLASKLGKLDLLDVQIDRTGTSGNYLSGFMGLHGLYYNRIEPHNLTAGHIHVGRNVSVDEATTMMEATLEIVLSRFPASMACQR